MEEATVRAFRTGAFINTSDEEFGGMDFDFRSLFVTPEEATVRPFRLSIHNQLTLIGCNAKAALLICLETIQMASSAVAHPSALAPPRTPLVTV
jgi:hypothetical protein